MSKQEFVLPGQVVKIQEADDKGDFYDEIMIYVWPYGHEEDFVVMSLDVPADTFKIRDEIEVVVRCPS